MLINNITVTNNVWSEGAYLSSFNAIMPHLLAHCIVTSQCTYMPFILTNRLIFLLFLYPCTKDCQKQHYSTSWL